MRALLSRIIPHHFIALIVPLALLCDARQAAPVALSSFRIDLIEQMAPKHDRVASALNQSKRSSQ